MPNFQTEPLFQLIKSLTKSEKRNFKLYANRIGGKEEMKFIKLFDALDKMSAYNEQVILKKVPVIKRTQLSNLKAHLYKQLLTSLRLNHLQHNSDIQVREQIDHAKVLYNKGLYKQSLKLLDKTKELAKNTERNILCLEIIEFEKLIESQYITRSIGSRADELTDEADAIFKNIDRANAFSNLSLRLYGLYIKVGHARNEKDYYMVKEFFDTNVPDYRLEELTFSEKLYLYQAFVWYNHIVQDFLKCYKYAQKWVDLFNEKPEMLENEPFMYIKGVHNLLGTLFNLNYYNRFNEMMEAFQDYGRKVEAGLNENEKVAFFLYYYVNKINRHFMEGTFSEGLVLVSEIEDRIAEYNTKIDRHRVLVFYYKIASLYFGSGDSRMAVKYLNKIINLNVGLREDIHCFARILSLIAHYELGNDDLLEYQVKSVYRFIAKMEDLHQVQKEIFQFLKRLPKIYPEDLKKEFVKLKGRLQTHSKNPYEQRPFLYLDIISWLESKISNRPVQEIVQEKFNSRRH